MTVAKSPSEVKLFIHSSIGIGKPEEFTVTRGVKGAVIGAINKQVGDDEHRRMVLAWLFDSPEVQMSTKGLDDNQWWALYQWVGFYQDENGEWRKRPEFPLEAMLVFTEAVKAAAFDNQMNETDSMLEQSVAFLGGVATNTSDALVYDYNPEVKAPDEYSVKRRVIKFLDGDDDIL